MDAARKISKRPVKVYAWMSAQTGYFIHEYAPKHFGGKQELLRKVVEETNRTGAPLELVANKVCGSCAPHAWPYPERTW